MESVYKYVLSCRLCQQNRELNLRPAGLLQPLPIPEGKWTHISMDFITGLPVTARGWNSIFVVVDRLKKAAHFIPTKTQYSASRVAAQFMENVFKLHGLPQQIVSDRDTKFMG